MSIAHCPNCGELEKLPFWKIGSKITCSKCKAKYDFKGKALNHKGSSEWDLTFDDFEQVLKDYMNLTKVREMIGKPLGIIVNESSGKFTFWAKDGKQISPFMVHELIQTDAKLQRNLYGFAMSHWR